MKFPCLIDWMEERGLDHLHAEHKDWQTTWGDKIEFSDFVQKAYENTMQRAHENAMADFHSNMESRRRPIEIPFDAAGDVATESAKDVLKQIIDKGLLDGMMEKVIDKEELAPDYNCAFAIVNAFWDDVIPALEKAMKNI